MRYCLAYISFLVLFCSCQRDTPGLENKKLDMPDLALMTPNDARVFLGRALFYDKELSLNGSVSCASCHKQQFAFADNKTLSVGFENKNTLRNSLPLQNLSLNTPLFWDGREQFLESLIFQPIVDHLEMGFQSPDQLVDKIDTIQYYDELVEYAYDTTSLTPFIVSHSISRFLLTLNSRNSKFENHLMGSQALSAKELLGFDLFNEKYQCNSCHQVQDPQGYIFAGTFSNIGLDEIYNDSGLEKVTGRVTDIGRFKIPNLKNVSVTAPYMHDGRFETLDEVIDHYSNAMVNHENLDIRLRGSDSIPLSMNITEGEKSAIISFLHTLTDYQFLLDEDFADPFIYY